MFIRILTLGPNILICHKDFDTGDQHLLVNKGFDTGAQKPLSKLRLILILGGFRGEGSPVANITRPVFQRPVLIYGQY